MYKVGKRSRCAQSRLNVKLNMETWKFKMRMELGISKSRGINTKPKPYTFNTKMCVSVNNEDRIAKACCSSAHTHSETALVFNL